MMNPTDYSEIVKKQLANNWEEYRKKLNIRDDDLKVALRIFAELAIEKSEGKVNVTLNPSFLEEKIKIFIETRRYFFAKICNSSFPFTLIDDSLSKCALSHCFQTHESIIAYLMTLDNKWLNEEALDNFLGNVYPRINIYAIAKTCRQFYRKYERYKDLRAGYYFLWLIKKMSEADFVIPQENEFNCSTASEILSQYLRSKGKINKITNFIEIFFYSRYHNERPLYQKIFDNESRILFLMMSMQQFELIPSNQWPNKINLLVQLLNYDIENESLINSLMASKDTDTAKLGSYFFNAFESKSFNEALPHFYHLLEFISYLDISSIFKIPFIELFSFFKGEDSKLIKKLNFSIGQEIFIHNSIIVGTYFKGDPQSAPYLLAFDLNTEKIIWGIPLTSKKLWCRHILIKVGNYLYLTFIDHINVKCIHMETGIIDHSFNLEKPYKPFDSLFINDMIYQISDYYLKCYSRHHTNDIIFGSHVPSCLPKLFSTYCGFLDPVYEKLILFNPEGKKATIENCLAAEAYENMLYTIEKNPTNKKACDLKIRNLELPSKGISKVTSIFSLKVSKAIFGNLCKNGLLILFSNEFTGTPIFVNLSNKKVIYSDHQIEYNSKKFIDTKTGEIWIIDESNQIWKISSEKITFMGTRRQFFEISFMHCEKNTLYLR